MTAGMAAPPPVIVSNDPGSFPWGVLNERHPALIERVRGATPYGPGQQRALDALLANIDGGVIEPLRPGAHAHEAWSEWGTGCFGRRWPDVPFLWAESYFYRLLLEALGYFGTDAWHGIDPFGPFKRAELEGPGVDAELASLNELSAEGRAAEASVRRALLHSSLWGNRADLGFRLSAEVAGKGGLGERVPRLVVDDSAALWAVLEGGGTGGSRTPRESGGAEGSKAPGTPGKVCLVADNTGPELLPDLVLADHLLVRGLADEVVLHVKPYPYYVSDATAADVIACLDRLVRGPGRAAETGARLREALISGRLVLRAHSFSCAPLPYTDMPPDLREDFATATLTVMKGDLNYRRLVGDRHWPATTPFTDVTAYFPGPVATLRTLKSDVVVGLAQDVVTALDADAGEGVWRTSGTHALIQVRA